MLVETCRPIPHIRQIGTHQGRLNLWRTGHDRRTRRENDATRPPDRMAAIPGRGAARVDAEPAHRDALRRTLHLPGVHIDLPGHGAAGLCPLGDRLCAEGAPCGEQVAEVIPRRVPQPRGLSRGLQPNHRAAPPGGARAHLASLGRLLVPARRHADRCLLSVRGAAEGRLVTPSGRVSVPWAGESDAASCEMHPPVAAPARAPSA